MLKYLWTVRHFSELDAKIFSSTIAWDRTFIWNSGQLVKRTLHWLSFSENGQWSPNLLRTLHTIMEIFAWHQMTRQKASHACLSVQCTPTFFLLTVNDKSRIYITMIKWYVATNYIFSRFFVLLIFRVTRVAYWNVCFLTLKPGFESDNGRFARKVTFWYVQHRRKMLETKTIPSFVGEFGQTHLFDDGSASM